MDMRTTLLATVVPLVLTTGIPEPLFATERSNTGPIPKIRVPAPAKVESSPRILTRAEGAGNEATEPQEERIKVDAAEATAARTTQARDKASRTITSIPAEDANTPRIGVRVATPEEDPDPEVATTPRVRKSLGTVGNEKSAPQKLERLPQNRGPVATPVEETADEPSNPPLRKRVGTQQVENTDAAEIGSTPRRRTRDTTAIGEAVGEQATPTRRRIGTPSVGGNLAKISDGPIRSMNVAQANCLFRGARNLKRNMKLPAPGSTALLEMVCVNAGKPKLTTFRYEVPVDQSVNSALLIVQRNDQAKLSSWIAFEPAPLPESADRSVYKLLGVSVGENDRQTITCIDGTASLIPAASNNEDAEGSIVEKWCSNGVEIAPRSFQVNNWLAPANLSVSLSAGSGAPGKQSGLSATVTGVEYEAATGESDSGPFLRRALGGAVPFTQPIDCRLQSNDPGSLYCTSEPINGIATTYLAYSLPEVRQKIGPLSAPVCQAVTKPVFDASSWAFGGHGGRLKRFVRYYDYTTVTCDTPKITYRLMPGKVPQQHRGKTGGACFIASQAGVTNIKIVKITYSRAVEATDEGHDVYDPNGDNMGPAVTEGKTIGTNGSIDPDTTLNEQGKRVPKENITRVTASCN